MSRRVSNAKAEEAARLTAGNRANSGAETGRFDAARGWCLCV